MMMEKCPRTLRFRGVNTTENWISAFHISNSVISMVSSSTTLSIEKPETNFDLSVSQENDLSYRKVASCTILMTGAWLPSSALILVVSPWKVGMDLFAYPTFTS